MTTMWAPPTPTHNADLTQTALGRMATLAASVCPPTKASNIVQTIIDRETAAFRNSDVAQRVIAYRQQAAATRDELADLERQERAADAALSRAADLDAVREAEKTHLGLRGRLDVVAARASKLKTLLDAAEVEARKAWAEQLGGAYRAALAEATAKAQAAEAALSLQLAKLLAPFHEMMAVYAALHDPLCRLRNPGKGPAKMPELSHAA